MNHILKCLKCEEYTLSKNCPRCNELTVNSRPAKYSPADKYAKYRRMAKEEAIHHSNPLRAKKD